VRCSNSIDNTHANQRRYHTQSPEALFTHTPGLRVVIPRSPIQAKGLLLSAIHCNDPVIFMEPKILYRAAVEQVPVDAYHLPLDKAEVLKTGKDVTIVSYGTPLYTCSAAIAAAEKDFGCSVELIDLRTIYPWDRETVLNSVKKTGRAIVVHESMMNAGVGAEVAAMIQEKAFLRLEAPVKRVAGWATHTGLMYEQFIIPDVTSKSFLNKIEMGSANDARGLRCYQTNDRLLKSTPNLKNTNYSCIESCFCIFFIYTPLSPSPLPYIVSHRTVVYALSFVALLYGHTCLALYTTSSNFSFSSPFTLTSSSTRNPISKSFILPTKCTVASTMLSSRADGIFTPKVGATAFMADWKHAP